MNKLAVADVFVAYDTVQLPRGKCKELRTKYLDEGGEKWLTIPAGKEKSAMRPIMDVHLPDSDWKQKHLDKLLNAYRRAPHLDWALTFVEECLGPESLTGLADIHCRILERLSEALGLGTRIVRASALAPYDGASLHDYVVELVKKAGGTRYFTGAGKGTMKTVDEGRFLRAGIQLEYQDYAIPPWKHLHGHEFVPGISVLDALFNLGAEAGRVIVGG